MQQRLELTVKNHIKDVQGDELRDRVKESLLHAMVSVDYQF